MSRGKHSEAEMIAALKQVQAGRKVEVVALRVTPWLAAADFSKHNFSCTPGCPRSDEELHGQLVQLARDKPRLGYRRL
jgi:hypothetical protein